MFKKIVWLWFSTKWKNKKALEEYIKSLVDSWAWEFFTWYNPPYWSDKFGFEVSPNWRFAEHEQITDLETLESVVLEVHKYDLEIFANLNAWYYTDQTFPLIKQMVEEFIKIWIDWIICWNISILEYLKEINYSGKINISTILAVYNHEAIKFFLENYKINKVILSREVTLKEIEELVTSFPETKFEAFWEWDFCRYNNWLCFAEHKYWAKDICTVVLNDLIIKKKFRPDFKEIILNSKINNEQKVNILDDSYNNIFEQIAIILGKIELWFLEKENLEKELFKIIWQNRNRVDLFFDALKSLNEEKNKNILIFLKWVKYLVNSPIIPFNKENENNKFEELKNLETELNNSFKTYIDFHSKKVRELGWLPKLKALETANLYAKWDNLNLYNYLFFSKFPNLDTIKFPTRWRNYSEKISLIEKTLKTWFVENNLIDRWASLERTHYDLTYLFWEKLWFRKSL